MTDPAYAPPEYLKERLVMPDPGFVLDWYLARHREAFDHWEQAAGQRTWRASSLGDCHRSQTLRRRGIPGTRPLDDKTIRTFAWGDEVHKFMRKVYWRLGLVVAEEPRLVDEAQSLAGSADLIWTPAGFDQPNDDEVRDAWSDDWNAFLDATRILWTEQMYALYEGRDFPNVTLGMELKSAHSFAMKRIFNEGPYSHHRIQAGAYKLMSKTTPPDLNRERWPALDLGDVDRWFITYVGKDAVGTLNYEVEDEWVEDAQKALRMLNRFWNAGKLPPCSCTDWQVKYCHYGEGDTCCGRNMKGRVAMALRKGTVDA